MAKVNRVKIGISLIEKEIENAKRLLEKGEANKNYGAACVQDGRILGLNQALDIIKACVCESKSTEEKSM